MSHLLTPKVFEFLNDSSSGVCRVGGRSGRARTRVRPSSAGARVYGKPGTGRGVGGEPCEADGGSGRRAQGNVRPQVRVVAR